MFFLVLLVCCLNVSVTQAYQLTVPTAIYVENTYTLKPLVKAEVTLKQKETDGKYYTYGIYETDSLGTASISLNNNKTYTVTTKKSNYYTQITVLSTNDISRTGKNKFGLSMRPKDCYRIKGQVETNLELTGNNYFFLRDLGSGTVETVSINKEGKYFACGKCGKNYSITPFLNDEQQKVDTIDLLMEYCQNKRNPMLKFNIKAEKAIEEAPIVEKEKGKYAKGDSIVLENLVFEGKTRQLNDLGNQALELLYQNLQENPKLIVELRVHTDARKSERYNWLLARKRGKFIDEFLIEKGVSPERYSVISIGETEIMNHCKNGKSCSKAEHAVNNRVEMKVIQGDKDFLD